MSWKSSLIAVGGICTQTRNYRHLLDTITDIRHLIIFGVQHAIAYCHLNDAYARYMMIFFGFFTISCDRLLKLGYFRFSISTMLSKARDLYVVTTRRSEVFLDATRYPEKLIDDQ